MIRLVRRACGGFRWVWVACEALFGAAWFVGGLVVVTLVCVGPRCYCWVLVWLIWLFVVHICCYLFALPVGCLG